MCFNRNSPTAPHQSSNCDFDVEMEDTDMPLVLVKDMQDYDIGI